MGVPLVVKNERANRESAPIAVADLNSAMWGPVNGAEALKFRGAQQRAELVRHWQEKLGKDHFTKYIRHASFCRPNAYKAILHSAEPEVRQQTQVECTEGKSDALTRKLLGASVLTATEERDLFRRYNFTRYLLAKVVASLDPETVTTSDMKEVRHYRTEVTRLRNKLFQANVKLAVAPGVRKHHPHNSLLQSQADAADTDGPSRPEGNAKDQKFEQLISDATNTIFMCIDKFDFSRKFKFSTYCCKGIIQHYLKLRGIEAKFRQRSLQADESVLEAIPATLDEPDIRPELKRARSILQKLIQSELSGVERRVLSLRLPLKPGQVVMTLEQVGEIIGVTKERIRQIQDKSLKKIRIALEERGEHLGTLL